MIRFVKTFVLIAAIASLVGAFRVTRFFYLKRFGDSIERQQEMDRDLEARRHEDQQLGTLTVPA